MNPTPNEVPAKVPVITQLPCCGYSVKEGETGPVMWNPYNKVVQCHACGQVYEQPNTRAPLPASVPAEDKTDWRSIASRLAAELEPRIGHNLAACPVHCTPHSLLAEFYAASGPTEEERLNEEAALTMELGPPMKHNPNIVVMGEKYDASKFESVPVAASVPSGGAAEPRRFTSVTELREAHEGHLCEKRCPKCGSALLRNKLGDEWCSFIECDFGIEEQPITPAPAPMGETPETVDAIAKLLSDLSALREEADALRDALTAARDAMKYTSLARSNTMESVEIALTNYTGKEAK